MLLWHPMDVYSIGFQLSFRCVGRICHFTAGHSNMVAKRRRSLDVLARMEAKDPTATQRFFAHAFFWVQAGLLAWLATFPLVAYDFGQASSWSIPGNLLMFPLVILSLLIGVLKILFTLLWPRWASIWAAVACQPVDWMQWCVHQLARLPGNSITLAAPPFWLIAVYYLLLLAPLITYKWRWILRLTPPIGVAVIILFPHFTQKQTAATIN